MFSDSESVGSRTCHFLSRVSDQARSKVLAAAAQLSYPRPNPSARSLRRGLSRTMGVVIGEHLSYTFDEPQAVSFLDR
jgi:DNA-binding LacI/PurR family transcriptional regulator